MGKFNWTEVRQLHNKLVEYPSYKDNGLRIYPGGDGNTILVVKRKFYKIDDDSYVSTIDVIDEFESYDELAAFMSGITWSYYEGVKYDD